MEMNCPSQNSSYLSEIEKMIYNYLFYNLKNFFYLSIRIPGKLKIAAWTEYDASDLCIAGQAASLISNGQNFPGKSNNFINHDQCKS
jgi:hypothetical protein